MSQVYKILYLSHAGEHGRLPDLGIVNIGGTLGPTFSVGGKPLLFADGSTTDGSPPSLSNTLQGAYNASTPATINLATGKPFTINALNSKFFSIDPNTGKVTITGDLEVLGASTVVEGVLANVDQVVINPPVGSAPGLIIEPQVGVTLSTDLVSIKLVNGGPSVFSISNTGDVYAGTKNVTRHLDGVGIKHKADEISVAGPFANVSGSNVEEALASIDTQLGGLAASISTYEHVQAAPAAMWTIVHGANSTRPTVTIYDATNYQILPGEVQIVDGNTVRVYFNTPIDGRAILILF